MYVPDRGSFIMTLEVMSYGVIGSGNGLSPVGRQAIAWKCCLIINLTLQTIFSEIWIKIWIFPNNIFKKQLFMC